MSEPLYIPAPLGGTNNRMLAAFADALRDQVIEGFHVYEAQVRGDYDVDFEDVVRVTVVVSDPPAGTDLWPAEQFTKLDAAISRMAWQFSIAEHIQLRVVMLRNAAESGLAPETVARAREAAHRDRDGQADSSR
jgi:hypothetical protein